MGGNTSKIRPPKIKKRTYNDKNERGKRNTPPGIVDRTKSEGSRNKDTESETKEEEGKEASQKKKTETRKMGLREIEQLRKGGLVPGDYKTKRKCARRGERRELGQVGKGPKRVLAQDYYIKEEWNMAH